jgi:acid phosphatase type 7
MRLSHKTLLALICSCSGALLQACATAAQPQPLAQPASPVAQAFSIPDSQLSNPLVLVIYGDMRFTDPGETVATSPGARRALVDKVASEKPDVLFLTGDIPWHGGDADDYKEFSAETAVWQQQKLRVFPVLGNHEFSQCDVAQCLENWWRAFPQFRDRRWYAVAVGTGLRAFALDSNSSLLPGSEQRKWLEREMRSLPPAVRFVILTLHHPPVADQSLLIVRRNERALAKYLRSIAPHSAAKLIVCSGHVHNYERFQQDGIVYLVSGGGGAKPLYVHRGRGDRYRDAAFPNFHYIRFEVQGDHLTAQMLRLMDYDAPAPRTWAVKDRFEVWANTP